MFFEFEEFLSTLRLLQSNANFSIISNFVSSTKRNLKKFSKKGLITVKAWYKCKIFGFFLNLFLAFNFYRKLFKTIRLWFVFFLLSIYFQYVFYMYIILSEFESNYG